jgi:nitrate reductase beta subunit
MCITPGCSGKSAGWLHNSGVEKIQRCFPRIPGNFSTLINRTKAGRRKLSGLLLVRNPVKSATYPR